jgi:hypothetical protein
MDAVETALSEHDALVNDAFLEALSGLVNQVQGQAGPKGTDAEALSARLTAIYRVALGYSMKKKMATGATGIQAA